MNFPYPNVIPKLEKDLDEILKTFSITLNKAINFGTYIVVWDTEKQREGKDNNIPTLFLRNLVEIADSISSPIQVSSIAPSKILFRTFLETRYGLLYLVERNELEKQRSKCFIISRIVKDIKYYKKFISDNQSSKLLRSKAEKDNQGLDFSKFMDLQEIEEIIKAKESLLKSRDFKSIYSEYLRTSKKNKTKAPNWYSLFDGRRNIEKLTEYLKKNVEYEFNYRKYSESVHSTNIMEGLSSPDGNKAQLIQIRSPEHCKDIFSSTTMFLIETYQIFINNRIPEKAFEFNNWYLEFRKVYNQSLKIEMRFQK